jgi:hypothetical protein
MWTNEILILSVFTIIMSVNRTYARYLTKEHKLRVNKFEWT